MREQGIIERVVSGNIVEVAFKRTAACEKCQLCHNVEENLMAIEAVDDIGAKIGDIVEIEIPGQEVVKGSMVIFLIPIFLLIAGYLLASSIMGWFGFFAWRDFVAVAGGLIAMSLSYFVIKWYDQNIQTKQALRAEIIRIISPVK